MAESEAAEERSRVEMEERARESTSTPAGVQTAQVFLCAFLIVLAAVLAYSNALGVPWTAADTELLVEQPALHGPLALAQSTDKPLPPPLAALCLTFTWAAGGGEALLYRLVHIALHAIAAVLLYLLCRRLFAFKLPEPAVMLGGMAFALHPAATAAVDQAVGRGLILATLLTVLSLLLYLRAASAHASEGNMSAAPWLISLLAFTGALACHPGSVVMLALLPAADWIAVGPAGRWKRLPYAAAYLLPVPLLGLAMAWGAPEGSGGGSITLGQALYGIPQYVYATFTGRGLQVLHAQPEAGTAAWGAWGAAIVLLLAGMGLTAIRKVAGLALLWYVLFAAATAFALARPDALVEPPVADRWMYPALAGAALLLPWVYSLLYGRSLTRVAAGAAAAVLLLAAGVGVFLRNGEWREPMALWQRAASALEQSEGDVAEERAFAALQLGRLHVEQARSMEAQLAAQFEEMDSAARQLEQDRILEQYALAAERLDAAVERRDSAEAHYLLGLSLHRQGQLEAAEDQYLAALAADAEDAEAALQLALLLQARASAENEALLLRAVDYYEKAARLGRLEPEATPSFAFALAGIGAYQRANDLLAQQFGEAPSPEENEQMTPFDLQRYEIALMSERIAALEDQATQIERQAPGSAESVLLRAQAALMEERYLRASYLLEEYRRVRPDDLGGWLILGAARAGMGAAESFLEEYPEPPTDAPGSQSPWFQLARITAMNDFWDAALTYLREGPAAEEAPLPLVAMGDVAAALGQRERAYEYLRQATEAHPEASSPWLKLFDLSLADGNLAAAQGYLDEAGGRGADTELLEARSAALQEAREARGEERPLTIIR